MLLFCLATHPANGALLAGLLTGPRTVLPFVVRQSEFYKNPEEEKAKRQKKAPSSGQETVSKPSSARALDSEDEDFEEMALDEEGSSDNDTSDEEGPKASSKKGSKKAAKKTIPQRSPKAVAQDLEAASDSEEDQVGTFSLSDL